jgi:hypothetical protein
MRKTKVKSLRKDFETTINDLVGVDRLRTSSIYKKLWRRFKKDNK